MKTLVFLLLFSLPLFAINIGESAPDFTLKALDGTTISLNDYQGKVVHLFFFGWG